MSVNIFETGTGLDALLGGGIRSGTALMLSGPPGSGKSLMALRFLARGLAKGEPGLYISFTRVPLSSTLHEAAKYPAFNGLLSSEEPLFLASQDISSAVRAVSGATRVVLDHPEALRDPERIEGLSELLATCRASGSASLVLSYETVELYYLCDGVAELTRSDGVQRVYLRKWPIGRTGVEEEREAGEWMR